MEKSEMRISPDAVRRVLGAVDDRTYALLAGVVKDMIAYYERVFTCNLMPNIWSERLEPGDYRDEFGRLDSGRSGCHNACISGLGIMNRAASKLGLLPVTNFDPVAEDRGNVANAIFNFVEEIVAKDGYREKG
jgi:hypothetical protein